MSHSNSHKVQIFNDAGETTGATFGVEMGDTEEDACLQTIRFDARGTTAGTRAYRAGLVVILERLGALGVAIIDVAVASKPAMKLSPDARRLPLGDVFPIHMRKEDAESMRKRFHTAAAKVGRPAGAKGGGNGTKRLRIWIEPTRYRNGELESLLSSGVAVKWRAA